MKRVNRRTDFSTRHDIYNLNLPVELVVLILFSIIKPKIMTPMRGFTRAIRLIQWEPGSVPLGQELNKEPT
jgi:hypothetical protein